MTILDIGCGVCNEAFPLTTFFGRQKFGSEGSNVRVIGIDISDEDIARAIDRNSSTSFDGERLSTRLRDAYQFITADASKLDELVNIPEQAGVVMLRHPMISNTSQPWKLIIAQAINKLSTDGIAILTSFTEIEHGILVRTLNELSCEVLLDAKNPHARFHVQDTNIIACDHYVAIVRKAGTSDTARLKHEFTPVPQKVLVLGSPTGDLKLSLLASLFSTGHQMPVLERPVYERPTPPQLLLPPRLDNSPDNSPNPRRQISPHARLARNIRNRVAKASRKRQRH